MRCNLARGVRATTAIEGNTLSESEVRRIISKPAAETLPKSRKYLAQEVGNIVDACNHIANHLIDDGDACKLTVEGIKVFNKMVLKDLPVEEGVVPGEISEHNLVVGTYRGAPRRDCEHLLERMCAWINDLKPPEPRQRIAYGVLRAVMAHLYLAWIHPFGDGNGRTARLLEVQILIGAGVPSVASHLLSSFYNQTRSEYYRQLSSASRSGGNVLPLVEYAAQGMVDQLDMQIRRIRKHQRAVAWRDYVYDSFRGMKTSAAQRQRLLALHLRRDSRKKRWIRIAEIRTLSAEIASEYAGKTAKTMTRDLNILEEKKLIRRASPARVAANVGLLQGFLPGRRAAAKRE